MFAKLKALLCVIGILPLLASGASADGFGITFTKKGKHSALGLQFESGAFCQPAPPPPVVACAPPVWVPGHYETVSQPVWIEGQKQKVWSGPVFEWRYDACGRARKVLVSPGHWKVLSAPGHYETRRVQTWQAGHWTNAFAHAP